MATKSAHLLLVYATEHIAPAMKVAAKETPTNSTVENCQICNHTTEQGGTLLSDSNQPVSCKRLVMVRSNWCHCSLLPCLLAYARHVSLGAFCKIAHSTSQPKHKKEKFKVHMCFDRKYVRQQDFRARQHSDDSPLLLQQAVDVLPFDHLS